MGTDLAFLLQLLKASGLTEESFRLPGNPEITSIIHDSREVAAGALFVCIRGAKVDGHELLDEAESRGAVAAIVERGFVAKPGCRLPLVPVSDCRLALAVLASEQFERPSERLMMIGVTGTNGKTSTSWLIAQIFCRLGVPCAYGGTFGLAPPSRLQDGESEQYARLESFQQTKNASPDPLVLQSFLGEILREGAKAAALEATSQGVAQKRTKGIHWDSMTFTNLTRDHLDLHGTMENYFALKAELFLEELAESCKKNRVAVVNVDDSWGGKLYELCAGKPFRTISYSRDSAKGAHACIRSAELGIQGSRIECVIDGQEVKLRYGLIGDYNVENVMAAVSTVYGLGIPLADIASVLADVPAVPGRIEIVSSANDDISVVVDYAHTPDGLIQVQRSLRPLCPGRLVTIFGCGGDRDRGKRPMMAQTVRELSDTAWVTSDNPRSEVPQAIIDDIIPGFELSIHAGEQGAERGRPSFHYEVEPDRKEAIQRAILSANAGDTILVAGKGHEDYQEVKGVRHPFLDANVCREALRLRGSLNVPSGNVHSGNVHSGKAYSGKI